MTTQTTLFDLDTYTPPPAREVARIDRDALERLAFCYTATEVGNATGIKFAATVPHAKAWCSSPLSHGRVHGTRWAYFWTTALSFVLNHCGPTGVYDPGAVYDIDLRGLRDNGEWDDRIASTGCEIIRLEDLPPILEAAGVVCHADAYASYVAARRRSAHTTIEKEAAR